VVISKLTLTPDGADVSVPTTLTLLTADPRCQVDPDVDPTDRMTLTPRLTLTLTLAERLTLTRLTPCHADPDPQTLPDAKVTLA
jgi:hypothetical protein